MLPDTVFSCYSISSLLTYNTLVLHIALVPEDHPLNVLKRYKDVISIEPPRHVQFTTVLLKASSDQGWMRYRWFLFQILFIYKYGLSIKMTWGVLAAEKKKRIVRIFKLEKEYYSIFFTITTKDVSETQMSITFRQILIQKNRVFGKFYKMFRSN